MTETINGYKEYASKEYVNEAMANAGGQSDWNENDESSLAYIKNRPFYTGNPVETTVTFAEETSVNFADIPMVENPFPIEFVEGETYTVTWDGTVYNCVAYIAPLPNTPSIGNGLIADAGDGGNGEPFFATVFDGAVVLFAQETGMHTISISQTQVIQEIHKIEDKYLPQSDWNENDPKSAAYVENRPFYYEMQQNPIVPNVYTIEFTATETTGDSGETLYVANIGEHFGSIERIYNYFSKFISEWGEYYGTPIFYSFDGVEYSLVESDYNDIGASYSITFGNPKLRNSSKGDNGEPAYVSFWSPADYNHYVNIYVADNKPHTISFYATSISVGKKLDSVFLDGGLIGVGSGANAEVFNDHGSNVASGENSHAEGCQTTASGAKSHAEGWHATASGEEGSHAEGYSTTASGNSSHAEGYQTTAFGKWSHSEGYWTHADGIASHSEGYKTYAKAESSHAEGNYTIASSRYQHVQGTYNIEDSNGNYAHIVGNGANEDNRSNVHTLDWNGNAWYQGTIKVGGTSYADASEVATQTETWTFTLEDGSTVTKAVYVG